MHTTIKSKHFIYLSLTSLLTACGGSSSDNNQNITEITQDLTAPTISFNKQPESAEITLGLGRFYKEYGATAIDNVDGELTVTAPTGTVDVNTLGDYTLVYSVSDTAGNEATIERIVHIVEPRPMVLTYRVEANELVAFRLNSLNGSIDFGAGDGYESIGFGGVSHRYTEAGDYTVRILGRIDDAEFCISTRGSFFQVDSLYQINDWGDVIWSTFANTFLLCDDMDENAYITLGEPDFLTAVSDGSVSVIRMESAFDSSNFNQPVNHWDVSNVTSMGRMFASDKASLFNHPLNDWDVSNLIFSDSMFESSEGNSTFDQDLSDWQISNLRSATSMFSGATLSISNYDALLNSWSTQEGIQSGTDLDAGNSQYSTNSEAARNRLINDFSWNITDGGLAP